MSFPEIFFSIFPPFPKIFLYKNWSIPRICNNKKTTIVRTRYHCSIGLAKRK